MRLPEDNRANEDERAFVCSPSIRAAYAATMLDPMTMAAGLPGWRSRGTPLA